MRWWDATINNRGLCRRSRAFVCGLSSPVLGLHSVGRLTSGRFCQVCLGTGDFLRPQGAIPPGLYPLQRGWVYCRGGRRYFWHCRMPVGFGPATGPTLKRPCAIFMRWWDASINTRGLRGCSQEPLGSTRLGSGIIVVAPISPPLLVADSTFFFTVLFKGYERSPSLVGASLAVINDQSK